jgi:two-component system response regulator GlrR
MRRLLIIEGDLASKEAGVHTMLLEEKAFSCDVMAWESLAPPTLTHCAHDLVILAATSHPVTIVDWLGDHAIGAPVLVVLPGDTDDTLLQRTSRIADDFIVLPFGPAELRNRIHRLLAQPLHDLEAVRRRVLEEMNLTRLVGRDPIFLQAIMQLPRFARSDFSICITGETGTGKELCARSIHHLSRRRASPFIAVDCGALPDQLFENEVFGHTRGAFTDAHRDQKGLVAMADGGTLFFDEVDALSVPAQAKLLRFLQERTYRPLGSDRFCSADVRVIAATNRDLEGSVRALQFRSDLFSRLNVLRLRLPPLRDRRSDIELLAYSALKEYSSTGDVSPRSFLPAPCEC